MTPWFLRKCLILQENFCKQTLQTIIDFQKQLVGGALKVLGKSLKSVLDEVSFIVNLHSFPLDLGSPGKRLLSPSKSFFPLLGRTTSKTSPFLYTSFPRF